MSMSWCRVLSICFLDRLQTAIRWLSVETYKSWLLWSTLLTWCVWRAYSWTGSAWSFKSLWNLMDISSHPDMAIYPLEPKHRAFFCRVIWYHVAVFGAFVDLEPVLFGQTFSLFFNRVDNQELISVANQYFSFLTNCQILNNIASCIHRPYRVIRDRLMKYFLHAKSFTISLGMPVEPPPPPAK